MSGVEWQLVIKHGFALVMSCITLWMMFCAGNKHPKAWLIGIVNQALWSIWIITTQSWGLVPMNIGMWTLCIRNHFLWNKKPG